MNQDLQKTLWAAADKLRSNIDAAEYKHIVLGLIFLKYVSDVFVERRSELEVAFADPNHDYFQDDADLRAESLEDRDFYEEASVFWVLEDARWAAIQANAKQSDIGKRIDDALEAIERENPRLKGILDKRFARQQEKAEAFEQKKAAQAATILTKKVPGQAEYPENKKAPCSGTPAARNAVRMTWATDGEDRIDAWSWGGAS